MNPELLTLADAVGARLKAAKQTVAVAESSSGGLVSAALLSVGGASAYYLGGGVIYTGKARMSLLDLPREAVAGMRSSRLRRILWRKRNSSQTSRVARAKRSMKKSGKIGVPMVDVIYTPK